MYAVVSTGGKQLKVEKGMEAVVEKLDVAVGDSVTFDVLFAADGDSIVIGSDARDTASVTAQVVEHFRGDKQVVFKFKKRKGYKRLKGHRQQQTRVLITDVVMGKAAAKAAPKATAKPEAPKAEKPKAEKPKAEAAAEKPKAEKPKAEAAAETGLDTTRCLALKSDGEQCANKPKEGSKYCGVHAKKYEG